MIILLKLCYYILHEMMKSKFTLTNYSVNFSHDNDLFAGINK